MTGQLRALFLGLTLSLAAASPSQAKSTLLSLSSEPLWPTSSTPDSSLVYSITAVNRGGAGILEVTLTAGNLPPGVTVTFSPSVLRFTGNQLSSQTAVMTVQCPGPLPLDCYPYTITGTAQNESVTITNAVLVSPNYVATRRATLYLDNQGDGALRLRGLGATTQTYQIQAATSLTNPAWTPLGSATADANGRFTFFTTQPTNAPARFYRTLEATP